MKAKSPVWPAWPGYPGGYQPVVADQMIAEKWRSRNRTKPPKNHKFSNPDADHRLSEITQRDGTPKRQPNIA